MFDARQARRASKRVSLDQKFILPFVKVPHEMVLMRFDYWYHVYFFRGIVPYVDVLDDQGILCTGARAHGVRIGDRPLHFL